jgi:hypothetical protein
MSGSILSIVNLSYDEETRSGTVTALIDDFNLVCQQSYQYPAEYGPGVAEAHFTLDEDEQIPQDSTELELFFEDFNLEWMAVDTSDWYD